MNFDFDRDRYLSRIGLSTVPTTDVDGLHRLHHAQFFSIPFENFDIQLDRGIALEPARLWDKLVVRRRGGYCFELNGLLLLALRNLGFVARPLLARVHLSHPPSGRTHQVNLVEFGGRAWLVDAGFGAGGPRAPLPIEAGANIRGPHWAYRLREDDIWGTVLQSREDGTWKDSYSFDLSHVTPADIVLSNHYTSTFPAVDFVTSRIASRPLPDGRVALRNFTLTQVNAGQSTTAAVEPGDPYLQTLKSVFGIELDAPYAALREPEV